jgi:hypothetical protein
MFVTSHPVRIIAELRQFNTVFKWQSKIFAKYEYPLTSGVSGLDNVAFDGEDLIQLKA